MSSISLVRLWVFVAIVGALLAACDNSSAEDASPTATRQAIVASPTASPDIGPGSPSPGPTTLPAATDAMEPDGRRILEDVITLSVSPRSSATELERVAAEEIAARLRSLGYEVTLQEFSVGNEQGRSSVLSLLSPTQRTVATLPLANSPTASVEGEIVAVSGVGNPGDFPDEVGGAIALIERGDLFFEEKVQNAATAGALAVIIYNNEPGTFFGSADTVPIPAVTISQREGQLLLQALQSGEIVASVGVGSLSDSISRNVIARPPGADCQTISGGHYDSVPQAQGASDNASGTATVLEIAAVLMNRGEAGSHCFVLFGAEELGLLGSRHFVATLSADDRARIKAMLNFDMVGVGDITWWLIGTAELQQRMTNLAAGLGIETMVSSLTGTSSDHASFLSGGIPALMFHRWQDPLLHTPQDISDRVKPEFLEQAAIMGLALLDDLGGEG